MEAYESTLLSLCLFVCMCIPLLLIGNDLVARKRLDKHVLASTNTRTTIELL
jgi:hypothetical protein